MMYRIQSFDNYKNICVPCVLSCVAYFKKVHISKPCHSMLSAICVPCVPFSCVCACVSFFIPLFFNLDLIEFNRVIKFSHMRENKGTQGTQVHKPYSTNTSVCVPYFRRYTTQLNKMFNIYLKQLVSHVYHFSNDMQDAIFN